MDRVARNLLLLWCSAAAAQEPAPDSTLRITVRLVQVDAVVTDSSGRRVTDLRAGDFRVLQDGVEQPVRYFSYVPAAPRASSEGKDRNAPLTGPPPATAGKVDRTIGVVVDDLGLSFEDLVRGREAVRKFILEGMQPGDLTAVVRTGGGIAVLEQFTTDRRVLLSAVDSLKWRFAGRCGFNPITPLDNEGAAAPTQPQLLDYGCSLASAGALGTLESVIAGMKRLPGRKSIVFLSSRLGMDSALAEDVDRLVDLANRAAVSVYAVDPSGLRADFAAASASASAGTVPGTLFGDMADLRTMERGSQDGLHYLASRTGGIFYANRNDISACIREAADDQAGYYLLGYTPPDGTFDDSNPKFHQVTVRVNRPGIRVRWKTGFSGKADVPQELTLAGLEKTREEQIAEALASPFSATAIKLRLSSYFVHTGAKGPGVRSILYFTPDELTFRPEPGGIWSAKVDIVTVAYRSLRRVFQQKEQVREIRLNEETFQQAKREGFLFNVDLAVKDPGPFLIRAVVRDAVTGKTGSASQFLEIPDTSKGRLAVSSIGLYLAEKKLIAEALPTAQDPTSQAFSLGSPAVRRYQPNSGVLYTYMVINPALKGNPKRVQLEAQLRVYRDGRLVFTGKANRIEARIDDQRYVGGGVLVLGGGMSPGEYVLQVVVTDRQARRKRSVATQWIDFEVTRDRTAEGRRRVREPLPC